MVIEFLKKYQEELISEKIQLKEDLDLLDTKINEETKFLSILEDNNDSYFTLFTPRNVNEKNTARANEIKENLINLKNSQQTLLSQMKFYESRLQEVTSLINGDSNRDASRIDNSLIIENDNHENDKIVNDLSLNEDVISSLKLLKSYIFQDPQRASIEIDSLISRLSL